MCPCKQSEKGMNFNMTNSLEKLEFKEIIKILSTYCKTYIGKNLCSNLMPSNRKETVKKLLDETR